MGAKHSSPISAGKGDALRLRGFKALGAAHPHPQRQVWHMWLEEMRCPRVGVQHRSSL